METYSFFVQELVRLKKNKMNKLVILSLKSIRRIYQTLFINTKEVKSECIQDADIASKIIYDALIADEPCMIARFGSTELACLINYVGVTQDRNKYVGYIKGSSQRWWWEPSIINQMHQWSGFFPATEDKLEQFCKLMLQDIPFVDILGSWLPDETKFDRELENAKKVWLLNLEPFWASSPWTKALEGKKVLVVHPFAQTIERQYKKRNLIFPNDLLPEFELITLKAVQSIAGEKTEYTDWFEALDYMKSEIDKRDYDICLIGCGAYGFPLAAHVKRMGKKAFHLGGSLQLLFGIRGKRWETGSYNSVYNYETLINDYWVRPDESEKPKAANIVEDSCYW